MMSLFLEDNQHRNYFLPFLPFQFSNSFFENIHTFSPPHPNPTGREKKLT